MDSEHWTFYISTVVGDCNSVKNGSNPATIDVYPKKTQGKKPKAEAKALRLYCSI